MDKYEMIIEEYRKGQSIRDVTKRTGASEVKVRKVLITEGLWSSNTSVQIRKLYDQGLSVEEIAEKIRKKPKTVQQYIPYSRGEYGRKDLSEAAKKSRAYRKRKQELSQRQVKTGTKGNPAGRERESSIKPRTPAADQQNDGAMKLHLELVIDPTEEELQILKKFGKVKNGISRDILVPSDMRLHNLHFAIQRAFGWMHCHLHHFAYPQEVFDVLFEDRLTAYLDFCGIYYRAPMAGGEDYYWDDDYDGEMSPKGWLKTKYSRPFDYGGASEHYLMAQKEAREFVREHPMLRVGPSFEEYLTGNRESKIKKIEDVALTDLDAFFPNGMEELLERLPLGEVIGVTETPDWQRRATELVGKANTTFPTSYLAWWKGSEFGAEEPDLCDSDPAVLPLSDTLRYLYDYGDGWEVEIQCMEAFRRQEGITLDHKGEEVSGNLLPAIEAVMEMGTPICIAADGLPVLDDVGGPAGYCCFLSGLHGLGDGPYNYDDKEQTRAWGRSQGWTGRMSRPEHIL